MLILGRTLISPVVVDNSFMILLYLAALFLDPRCFALRDMYYCHVLYSNAVKYKLSLHKVFFHYLQYLAIA